MYNNERKEIVWMIVLLLGFVILNCVVINRLSMRLKTVEEDLNSVITLQTQIENKQGEIEQHITDINSRINDNENDLKDVKTSIETSLAEPVTEEPTEEITEVTTEEEKVISTTETTEVTEPVIEESFEVETVIQSPPEDEPVASNCLGAYEITAYTWTGNPCADGVYPASGYTAACNDPNLWHRWVYIEGYGSVYIHDTGGMPTNSIIDVYMDSESECINWGRQVRNVYWSE